jgi:hypothetical protein
MSADKISDEDLRTVLHAVKVADAAHRTNVRSATTNAYRWGCSCGHQSGDTDYGSGKFESAEHLRKAIASAVLAALAGRLLPAGAEEDPERADWVVVAEQPNMPGVFLPWGNFTTRKRAERGLEELRGDGHNGAIRTRQVWVGPWVNVEEGS